MKTAHYFLIGILLMFGGIAEAMSKKSALTVDLLNLGHFIQLYHDQEGKYPQSWDELEKFTPDLDGTFSSLKPTRRMLLMSPPFELPYSGGMALAMTRDAYRRQSWSQFGYQYLEDPEYGVIFTKNGGVFLRHIPPEAIKTIFEAEGLALPKPSGLGSFPHEKGFVSRRFIFIWIAAMAFGSWLIWRFIQRQPSPNTTT